MNNRLKLATMDFSKEIAKWTMWYLPIMAVIYILVSLFVNETEVNEMSFYAMASSANRIFMLVAGILAVFMFLELAISLGLTRKTFLNAMILTGGVVTIGLAVVTWILSLVLGMMPWFGDGIVAADTVAGPLAHIVSHLITAYVFFLAGFIISIGFYRGFLGGMIAIVLSLGITAAIDAMWTFQTAGTFFNMEMAGYGSGNLLLTIIFSILLILFTIAVLQSLIRSVPVKVK
ncbi:hypothetical protein [Salinicoccus sp. RF5]|uniref:hypothetical protein n=1 Tax=Salinicoccus sp. RF5 TaxID=2748874 RepID=UPI001E491FD4|nr:hypothetical protein [Salinicoccus sp. RF5]MCC4722847.1 hypothetical protein [Salinicoccus sp. RF5]